MNISLRLTGVFSLSLMENRLGRGAGYADLQDGPHPFHTHKISLCWRNSSKPEDIWSGNAFDFPEASGGKDSSYMANYNHDLNPWLSLAA